MTRALRPADTVEKCVANGDTRCAPEVSAALMSIESV
jgi:hypothetical protein